MLPATIDWFNSPSIPAPEETPVPERPSVIAIGKFDGIHRGHRALLGRVVDEARRHGMAAGVVTFDAHPRQVLFGEKHEVITGLSERRALLRGIGLDFQYQLHACTPLLALDADDFARQLMDALHCRIVFMGSDFRFGRKAMGDSTTFVRLGAAVRTIDLMIATGDKVSSTRVREALRAGDIETANALLGRAHGICGFLRHGSGSNWRMAPLEGLAVPSSGTYAGHVGFRDSTSTVPALIHVPQAGQVLSVEVFPYARTGTHLLTDPVEGMLFFERRVAAGHMRHGSGGTKHSGYVPARPQGRQEGEIRTAILPS